MITAERVWRLVAHHEEPEQSLEEMQATHRIAIGWSDVGDLRKLKPESPTEIGAAVNRARPDAKNASLAGPSLWNLYWEMNVGDKVIVTSKSKRKLVFEVLGEYFFDEEAPILNYSHMRAVATTEIDPEELWKATGGEAEDQNVRWTLFRCGGSNRVAELVFEEGRRFTVSASAIERDPGARRECLREHGYRCSACDMSFNETYGPIGKEFIHVHHRVDLALIKGKVKIDPKVDLVPLCPNCHAMVHTEKPAMSVERLREHLRAGV
jgi:hypothetical protein